RNHLPHQHFSRGSVSQMALIEHRLSATASLSVLHTGLPSASPTLASICIAARIEPEALARLSKGCALTPGEHARHGARGTVQRQTCHWRVFATGLYR